MWEEYRGWTPYQYGANNPIAAKDGSGFLIEFVTEADRQEYVEAMEYLESKGIVEATTILRALLEDEGFTIYMERTNGKGIFYGEAHNQWKGGVELTLYWHSEAGLEYKDAEGNVHRISAALVLLHEGTHAWLEMYFPKEKKKMQSIVNSEGQTQEHDFIIEDIEGPAAVESGEATSGRLRHKDGLNFLTNSPTSNVPETEN